MNYQSPEDYSMPMDIRNALEDYETNPSRYKWARNRAVYQDKAGHPYLHLMDGGLADNIGLRPILSAYQRSSGFIGKLKNDGQIEKLVFIVVNARTEDQDKLSQEESPPGLGTVAFKTATISLDNYSFETIESIKAVREERLKAQQVVASCQKYLDKCQCEKRLPEFRAQIDPYVIEINFEAIPDEQRRRYFLNLPTSFALSNDQVQSLIDIAPVLLDNSPEFISFMNSIGP